MRLFKILILFSIIPAIGLTGQTGCIGTEVGNPDTKSGVGFVDISDDLPGPEAIDPQEGIIGVVHKGPVAGATVIIYRIENDGSVGELIAQLETNGAGAFGVLFASNEPGPLLIDVGGGSFIDEDRIPEEATLTSLKLYLPVAPSSSGSSPLAVTVLSDIAAARIAERFANETVDDAAAIITEENDALAGQFGLDALTDTPHNPFTELPEKEGSRAVHTLLYAGLSRLSVDYGYASTEALADVLAEDYTDGTFDALNADGGSLSGITTDSVTTDWAEAINDFLDPANEGELDQNNDLTGDGTNLTGVTQDDWQNLLPEIPIFN